MVPNRKHFARIKPIAITSLWCMIGISCIIYGLREHGHLFVRVQDIIEQPEPLKNKPIRLGGIVAKGTIQKSANGISFYVRDHLSGKENEQVMVEFNGILPNLFQEGKAIIANGYYKNDRVIAKEILAKHDENYQIPEVKKR